jgi:hypothetical protein
MGSSASYKGIGRKNWNFARNATKWNARRLGMGHHRRCQLRVDTVDKVGDETRECLDRLP